MTRTGAEAIAGALHGRGVDTVFGLPGVHNLPLWPACAGTGVRIVGSRHEQGCTYAADGYARATGRTGVALTTTGPGAANTLGAVGEAWASHSPMVVIASDIATTLRRPGTYRGVLHECTDQAALFAPVTKARVDVGRADDLADAVGSALTLAHRAPRGPVYLGVPTDLLTTAIAAPAPAIHAVAHPDAIGLLPLAVADPLMDLLARSERPLLWIGGGTRDAGSEIDRVARALGAPVIATFQARGVLPASHPLLVGAPPHEPPVTALVERADFVLVIGSDLDHMNTMGWRLPLPEARAAINIDEADATKNYSMNAVVEADANEALRALRTQLSRLPTPQRAPWVDDVPAITRVLREELRTDTDSAPAVEFLERTRVALPDESVVFADMCIAGYWLSGHYPVECGRGLHYPMGWGTLGFAFAASIGAAVAVGPSRAVVAVMGDGGMLFALGELATVAQERLALTIVVVDDGGYGMLRYGREDEPNNGCDLSPVDFVAVAEGFGIAAEHVDGLGDDYGQALAKAAASGEPRLIHAQRAARSAAHHLAALAARNPLKGRPMGFRVTYATPNTDDDALHAAYDRGIEIARGWLGEDHGSIVDGEHPRGIPGMEYEERSPGDRDVVIGRFAHATPDDVSTAVAAAHAAAPAWAATPWKERVAILERAADQISQHRSELAALMAMEVGKNRLEALGDVEESADLIRYYCHQMEANDGFAMPMGRLSEREATSDVMRPYGVWAVISPFNFPMALAAGPLGAALVAGNTAVLKPSEQGAFTGLMTVAALHEAGVPKGVLHAVTGPGETVGAALVEDPRVDGLTFTGSYETGMQIFRSFATAFPKPVICEMGGKNPVIVSARADIDAAAEGTMRSAFGLQGQKCSAASRAYVDRSIYGEFVAALVERTRAIKIGDPLERGVYLGPVVDEDAVARFETAVEEARRTGQLFVGGHRVVDGDLARGNYLEPTVVELPRDSALWETELFVPLIAVTPVDSLDEAFALANATPLALTAGFFSEDQSEVDEFLDRVEAGVVYVNRRAGATTGAWPGVQPFGGWKGSGTNGKAGGGPYYLQQYLREQSRTVVSESSTQESSTQ